MVIGPNGDRIMGREACMPTLQRFQQPDARVVEQVFSGKERDHIPSQQKLGRMRIDIGYGAPAPATIPTAARAERVNMRVPAEIRGSGVDGLAPPIPSIDQLFPKSATGAFNRHAVAPNFTDSRDIEIYTVIRAASECPKLLAHGASKRARVYIFPSHILAA